MQHEINPLNMQTQDTSKTQSLGWSPKTSETSKDGSTVKSLKTKIKMECRPQASGYEEEQGRKEVFFLIAIFEMVCDFHV